MDTAYRTSWIQRIGLIGYVVLSYVGIKSLLDAIWITAAHDCVNAAQLELVLLVNINCPAEVNAANDKMLEVTTASDYQVNAAS
ncbi:hypothetical protein Tco_1060699 [Tanacetum coccineum]